MQQMKKKKKQSSIKQEEESSLLEEKKMRKLAHRYFPVLSSPKTPRSLLIHFGPWSNSIYVLRKISVQSIFHKTETKDRETHQSSPIAK
jgi:hypothetical protein